MVKIGAHMPIGGGFKRVPKETVGIGGNTFQIFPHNPRQWKANLPKKDDVKKFNDGIKKYGISQDSMLCHSGYLINLASPKHETWEKSLKLLISEMQICTTLGIKYLNIHPGSHLGEGLEIGVGNIVKALDIAMEQEKSTFILLENVTKKGGNIGYELEHLKNIIDKARYPERIGITIDTCHAWDAGYNITDPIELDKFLNKIDKLFSLKKLLFVHLNDSKNELGSNKDRHENIGKGRIGINGFKVFLNHEIIKKIPWILETPGDNDVHAQDIKEVLKILEVE
ncbi:deoxyribonuclease IV [Thermosipho atlanticus]|uniref:Probable endonuclease 4 n=1 Tax=Thermosipho atlanticus DSM 15807 TaxID=1123380 RepID=A0A1M5R030_9BACT|nr:deoxyribonuclease IV [Thermosipho atlanticus]SHH19518.1 Endonuclease IV [Thermosipho atlanticus DSM 15807]